MVNTNTEIEIVRQIDWSPTVQGRLLITNGCLVEDTQQHDTDTYSKYVAGYVDSVIVNRIELVQS